MNTMMQAGPAMMGCCAFFGIAGWLLSAITPLIAIAAMVCLLTARPRSTMAARATAVEFQDREHR